MMTLTDMFCGAGGSSTGAIAVPGVEVRVATNHWNLAIETHNTNHQCGQPLPDHKPHTDAQTYRRTDELDPNQPPPF